METEMVDNAVLRSCTGFVSVSAGEMVKSRF